MTDPVDTDALAAAWDKYAALNDIHPHSIERDVFEQGWDAAADEVDRLRSVIENAPHDGDCWLREDADEGVLPEHRNCTCWKADAK